MSNLKYTNIAADGAHEDDLARLALDVSLPSRHTNGDLWERLNPELWNATHNPWAVMQTVSRKTLDEVTSDPAFQQALRQLTGAQANEESLWFRQTYPHSPL